PGGGLVPPDRPQLPSFPHPPLVSPEARTVVRGPFDHVASGQPRGENRGSASETQSSKNLGRPTHRASQPRGLSRASAGASGLPERSTRDSPGGNLPPGPIEIRHET